MAEPSWQELLRLRLAERNSSESAFAPIIEQCEQAWAVIFLRSIVLGKIAGLPNKPNS